MRLTLVSVPVSDVDRAKAFYVERLGFREVVDTGVGEGMRWCQLAPPQGEAAITLVTWLQTMPAGSQQGMVLAVDDVRAERDALAARGVEVTEVEEQAWGTFATFADPDGNRWVLSQPRG